MIKKIMIAITVVSSASAFAAEFTCTGMYKNFGEVAKLQINGKDATFSIQYYGIKTDGKITANIEDWYVTRVKNNASLAEVNISKELIASGGGVVAAHDSDMTHGGDGINTWFYCKALLE